MKKNKEEYFVYKYKTNYDMEAKDTLVLVDDILDIIEANYRTPDGQIILMHQVVFKDGTAWLEEPNEEQYKRFQKIKEKRGQK